MARRQETERFSAADIVPIAGNGSIAGPVLEGVAVPALILDTRARPDVSEAIRVHSTGSLPPGDVNFRWGGRPGCPDEVLLVLDLLRPLEVRIVLSFSIEREAILVESALTARAVYLQAGKPGDRLKHDLDRPKMLVELPETGFGPIWERLVVEQMTAVFARDMKIRRRKARPQAVAFLADIRNVTGFRMPQTDR
jgi:hypothetical protein